MRNASLMAVILSSVTLAVPSIAWASVDCGNPPTRQAEVVHKIATPQQALAPQIETPEPIENVGQTQSQIREANISNLPQHAAPEVILVAEADAPPPNPAIVNYGALLKRRISRGEDSLNLFDYAGAHAAGEMKIIKAYTDYLASQNPDELSEPDQIAYWANLYNALTVNLILENYPVKSIRKIKAGAFSLGPWKRDEITVDGDVLSLDDIEHQILRKRYDNPALVHYMVNCASIGCPNLQPKLWDGATLDADRDAAAREFINSSRGVAIDGTELKVSSIYNWFKEDFGGSKSATLDHFRKYAGPELKAALDAGAKITGDGYNWKLNE